MSGRLFQKSVRSTADLVDGIRSKCTILRKNVTMIGPVNNSRLRRSVLDDHISDWPDRLAAWISRFSAGHVPRFF